MTARQWDDPVFAPIRDALVRRMVEVSYEDSSPEHADSMMRSWDYFTDNAVNDRGCYDLDGIHPEVVRLLWKAFYLHYGVADPSVSGLPRCGICGSAGDMFGYRDKQTTEFVFTWYCTAHRLSNDYADAASALSRKANDRARTDSAQPSDARRMGAAHHRAPVWWLRDDA